MIYQFHGKITAFDTVSNINYVFDAKVTSQLKVNRWFKKFPAGNFNLLNKLRGRPKTQVDNDALKATVETDPRQSDQGHQ